MNFKGKEISEEIIAKAMACKSAEELMKLAKAGGIELTKDEAEAYMAEMEDVELNDEEMKLVAGGSVRASACPGYCMGKNARATEPSAGAV